MEILKRKKNIIITCLIKNPLTGKNELHFNQSGRAVWCGPPSTSGRYSWALRQSTCQLAGDTTWVGQASSASPKHALFRLPRIKISSHHRFINYMEICRARICVIYSAAVSGPRVCYTATD